MFRKTTSALLGAALAMPMLLAVPAAAQTLPLVKEINVQTDLTALNNAEAAAYWGTLDTDLESAIAARLVDRLGSDGIRISVNVSEVELANVFQAGFGTDETMMRANVNVSSETDNTAFESFELTLTMGQIMPLLPADTDLTIITPTSAETYAALIENFASAVVNRIDG